MVVGIEERFHIKSEDTSVFKKLNYFLWAHSRCWFAGSSAPHPFPLHPHTGQTHRDPASTGFAGASQPPSASPSGRSRGGQPGARSGDPREPPRVLRPSAGASPSAQGRSHPISWPRHPMPVPAELLPAWRDPLGLPP